MSSEYERWIVWCETEQKLVYTSKVPAGTSSPPTECPNDSAHTIDQSRTEKENLTLL